MSVGDDLRDSAARHSVYNLRYARSTYRRHSKLIDQAVADLTAKLASRAPLDGSFTRKRLEAMLKNIKGTSAALYSGLQSAVDGDLRELAAYESSIQVAMIEDAYPIKLELAAVAPATIHAAAMSQPFLGKVLKNWWKDQEYGVRAAFQSAVRIGFVNGETLSQISRRVRGVGGMTQRQVESVIRTAVAHVSQTAMNATTEANADIIEAEEWVATLDGRTTAVCRGLDGKRFPIGKGPQIPIHWGERSRRVPVPKSFASMYGDADGDSRLSDRPFVADRRRVKDIPKSERADIIGATDTKSYNEWLKTQRRPFIDDVLGKKKAKLYLDGDLSLDRFTDRTGREYTLVELEKRERKAFKKAEID